MTPGEYLRRRRVAREMSVASVETAVLAIDPRGNGLLHHLATYERGEVGLMLTDACLLANAIDFDLTALAALAAGAPPPICRVCACSEEDPCINHDGFETCSWAEDDLCSACVEKEEPADV